MAEPSIIESLLAHERNLSDWQPNIFDGSAGKYISIDSSHFDECMERFYADNLTGIHISSLGAYSEGDLSFLRDHPSITAVAVSHGKGIDLSALALLEGLTHLTLEVFRAPPDLRKFKSLREFSGEWSPDLKIDESCVELKKLTLFKYKCRASDCSEIPVVPSLERLELIQSSITSLKGIECHDHVNELFFCRLSKLESIDDIAGLARGSLWKLKFERCKKISDWCPLGSLNRVKKISIDTCSELPNLSFLSGCSGLEEFVFMDAKLPDGDLAPLLELPSLRYLGTFDKKHFSHKEEEINSLLAAR